jgi:hypothetical protein
MSAIPHAARAPAWTGGLRSSKTLGVLAVLGLVVAFSFSSTLVKRAETAGVLVAFWRLVITRNEGVRGSSPRVGFSVEEVPAHRNFVLSRQAWRAQHRE